MAFADLDNNVLTKILLEAVAPEPVVAPPPLALDDAVWVRVQGIDFVREYYHGPTSEDDPHSHWVHGTVKEADESGIQDKRRVLVKYTTPRRRAATDPTHLWSYTMLPGEELETWFGAGSESLERRDARDRARPIPPTRRELQKKRLQGVGVFLARMELTAKLFDRSVVEEVAKCILTEDGPAPRRRFRGQRWTLLLHELEKERNAMLFRTSLSWPLSFTKLRRPAVSHKPDTVRWGMCLTTDGVELVTAVCDQAPMIAGVHHAEFTSNGGSGQAIGVLHAGKKVSLMQGASSSTYTQRTNDPYRRSGQTTRTSDAWGWVNVKARPPEIVSGQGWDRRWKQRSAESHRARLGCPPEISFDGWQSWEHNDKLGLTLDLGRGTLRAFKNGQLVGQVATNLGAGPFFWYVDLAGHGQEMKIEWGQPPAAAQTGAGAAAAVGAAAPDDGQEDSKKQKV